MTITQRRKKRISVKNFSRVIMPGRFYNNTWALFFVAPFYRNIYFFTFFAVLVNPCKQSVNYPFGDVNTASEFYSLSGRCCINLE